MTSAASLVPADTAPRVRSLDPRDHPAPDQRDESWRFAALKDLAPLLDPDSRGSGVVATPNDQVANSVSGRHGWLPTDRPLAVARSAAANIVTVDIGPEQILQAPAVVHLEAQGPIAHQHVEITAGHHSKSVVVVECAHGAAVSGAVSIEVGDGADLVVLLQCVADDDDVALIGVPVSVGRDASVTLATIAVGGRAVRLTPSVSYRGPGGKASILGAFLVQGHSSLEQRVFVEHVAPHCTSRVAYKGALSGAGARSVWIGDVIVRHSAIGTDTYELNRNLLLDDGPRADSVPNLELETGEIVGAGHASATGRFDEQQLFYLQARGIPADIARQLIVRGFFAEVLGAVPDASVRARIDAVLAERLGLPTGESDDPTSNDVAAREATS